MVYVLFESYKQDCTSAQVENCKHETNSMRIVHVHSM